MSTRISKWISGIGVMVVGGLLLTSVVGADDDNHKNPFTQILTKLDQILAAVGPVDLCHGGTTVGRFVVKGTEVCDRTTGLTWQQTPDATLRTNAAAVTYCLGLGNHYRLPEIKELISLLDYSQFNPTLPPGIFTGVANDGYWSATQNAQTAPLTWIGFFNNGSVVSDDRSNNLHVWCVRGA